MVWTNRVCGWLPLVPVEPHGYTHFIVILIYSPNAPESPAYEKPTKFIKRTQRKLFNATPRHSKSNKQTTRKHTYWITRLCEGIANSHTWAGNTCSCGLWARCDAFTRISLYLLLICLNCTCCVIVAIFDPTHAHKSKTDLFVCMYATSTQWRSAQTETTERAYTHNNHSST